MTDRRIRLVPPAKTPKPLTIGDAREAASNAYTKARAAQRALVSRLTLVELMYRPGQVSYARLRGERHEAVAQLERAQTVVDALNEAIESMEAASK